MSSPQSPLHDLLPSLSAPHFEEAVGQLERGQKQLASFSAFLHTWSGEEKKEAGGNGGEQATSQSQEGFGGQVTMGDENEATRAGSPLRGIPGGRPGNYRCKECICQGCGVVMSAGGGRAGVSELEQEVSDMTLGSQGHVGLKEHSPFSLSKSAGSAPGDKPGRVPVGVEMQLVGKSEASASPPSITSSEIPSPSSGLSNDEGLTAERLVLVTFWRESRGAELEAELSPAKRKVAALERQVAKLTAHHQYTLDLHPDLIFAKDKQVRHTKDGRCCFSNPNFTLCAYAALV